MEKRWSIIKDFPNYKISSDSEVINLTTGNRVATPMHQHGYRCVRLWNNGKTRLLKIYRLKAIAFIPNPDNKKEVNHLDGDRLNEDLSNLEWSTPSENMKHAVRTGLARMQFKSGLDHVQCKLTRDQIYEIRRLRNVENKKLREICILFGISDHQVSMIANYKSHKNV